MQGFSLLLAGHGNFSFFLSSLRCKNFVFALLLAQLRGSQYGRPSSMPTLTARGLSSEVKVIVEAASGAAGRRRFQLGATAADRSNAILLLELLRTEHHHQLQ